VWELDGRDVTLLLIDFDFRFHCWTLEGDLQARFGTPFTFAAADGREWKVDPEHPRTVAPLLDIAHAHVAEIRVRRDGRVSIAFTDGAAIRSEPHPSYEAWEIGGVGDLAAIGYLCGPGGGSPWG
jgi:hypothetical protein